MLSPTLEQLRRCMLPDNINIFYVVLLIEDKRQPVCTDTDMVTVVLGL